jgi:ribosomal protein S18 acetylase RimI-like enzyme
MVLVKTESIVCHVGETLMHQKVTCRETRRQQGEGMIISTIQGTTEHLDECVEALLHSTLGHTYFPTREQATTSLYEGFTNKEIWIARLHEQSVGFYWWLPHGAFHAFPYLHILAVHQQRRGQGIGSQLLTDFERRAFAEASKVFLVVADFNPSAKRFYCRRGYLEVGVIPGLYRPGIAEHLLMKIRDDA